MSIQAGYSKEIIYQEAVSVAYELKVYFVTRWHAYSVYSPILMDIISS